MLNNLQSVAKLCNTLSSSNFKYLHNVIGKIFAQFDDCTVIYALIEYAKFDRKNETEHRLEYLYRKCCEYENIIPNKVQVRGDIYDEAFLVDPEHGDLPF